MSLIFCEDIGVMPVWIIPFLVIGIYFIILFLFLEYDLGNKNGFTILCFWNICSFFLFFTQNLTSYFYILCEKKKTKEIFFLIRRISFFFWFVQFGFYSSLNFHFFRASQLNNFCTILCCIYKYTLSDHTDDFKGCLSYLHKYNS